MKKFNIRVYGLLINNKNEILVSDEERFGVQFTKFPGGGLEWGEGTIDGLKREFLEELNINIEVNDLFYLTDFFQASAFHENDQIISIYYFVSTNEISKINSNINLKFSLHKEEHRWININSIRQDDLTFPIDKVVIMKLMNFLSKQATFIEN
jgi:8-oxo-dGTP diphosphatase